jgi:hypothetical protein
MNYIKEINKILCVLICMFILIIIIYKVTDIIYMYDTGGKYVKVQKLNFFQN